MNIRVFMQTEFRSCQHPERYRLDILGFSRILCVDCFKKTLNNPQNEYLLRQQPLFRESWITNCLKCRFSHACRVCHTWIREPNRKACYNCIYGFYLELFRCKENPLYAFASAYNDSQIKSLLRVILYTSLANIILTY